MCHVVVMAVIYSLLQKWTWSAAHSITGKWKSPSRYKPVLPDGASVDDPD
jgi:hypothetical protein